jgi:hypothetical protein
MIHGVSHGCVRSCLSPAHGGPGKALIGSQSELRPRVGTSAVAKDMYSIPMLACEPGVKVYSSLMMTLTSVWERETNNHMRRQQ